MQRDQIGVIVAAVLAGGGALGSVVILLLRKIILYLFDRIATLETREQSILQKLPEAMESQQETLKITADYVREMSDDARYRRRAMGGGSA